MNSRTRVVFQQKTKYHLALFIPSGLQLCRGFFKTHQWPVKKTKEYILINIISSQKRIKPEAIPPLISPEMPSCYGSLGPSNQWLLPCIPGQSLFSVPGSVSHDIFLGLLTWSRRRETCSCPCMGRALTGESSVGPHLAWIQGAAPTVLQRLCWPQGNVAATLLCSLLQVSQFRAVERAV